MLSGVLRAHRAKSKSLCSFFQKVFEMRAGKVLQTGSICKLQLQQLGVTKLAKNYEKWVHLAALITQHLTSAPSQIKRKPSHLQTCFYHLQLYLRLQQFSINALILCASGHAVSQHPCPGQHTRAWSELQRPAKLSHSRQAMGKSASHRAWLLFKNSKSHKKKGGSKLLLLQLYIK